MTVKTLMAATVHVAVAVIVDQGGNILISKRPESVHQGGVWEFPGGKVEPEENIETALAREIAEELGITVLSSSPLISIPFDYGDKFVHLHVRRVSAFNGEAHGREGQEVRWVSILQCDDFQFPAANQTILSAIRLPNFYYITPEPDPDLKTYLSQLGKVINAHATLIQFRAKFLSEKKYKQYALESIKLCREHNVTLLLNADFETAIELGANGVHVSSAKLMHYNHRPVASDFLFAASCHNHAELEQAQRIEADFAVLGAVQPTASHPNAATLGWDSFAKLLKQVRIPVFALGGLHSNDMRIAQENGAQGIAAIRSLWPDCR